MFQSEEGDPETGQLGRGGRGLIRPPETLSERVVTRLSTKEEVKRGKEDGRIYRDPF